MIFFESTEIKTHDAINESVVTVCFISFVEWWMQSVSCAQQRHKHAADWRKRCFLWFLRTAWSCYNSAVTSPWRWLWYKTRGATFWWCLVFVRLQRCADSCLEALLLCFSCTGARVASVGRPWGCSCSCCRHGSLIGCSLSSSWGNHSFYS